MTPPRMPLSFLCFCSSAAQPTWYLPHLPTDPPTSVLTAVLLSRTPPALLPTFQTTAVAAVADVHAAREYYLTYRPSAPTASS